MLETAFNLTQSEVKLVENVLNRDHIQINHMILNQGEALPEHYANSNVYMVVLKGNLNLTLEEETARDYTAGHLVEIPFNLKMNVRNISQPTLELMVIKAPHPDKYPGEQGKSV
ncbi:MAG: hypothetical protein AVO33_07030 [delta proteobacterium ML8_F1]|nr:MAG: hypothetical protein AVO33_07030 [delta proteobacterium ML8_F1]